MQLQGSNEGAHKVRAAFPAPGSCPAKLSCKESLPLETCRLREWGQQEPFLSWCQPCQASQSLYWSGSKLFFSLRDLPPPAGSMVPLKIESVHVYIISYTFIKGKTLTTDLPTLRENSLLTGKAEGKPSFSVHLNLMCCYVVPEDRLLAHRLQLLAQWIHTSVSTSPISKLSDGSCFWDMAQLQECQPRMVPMCCHCPLCPRMARAAWQQLTFLAAACSSQVLNLCQFQTCPPLQWRSGLGHLLCSNLRVVRIHFSVPGLNLVFQWTGFQSEEMLPVTRKESCALVREESPQKCWGIQPGEIGSCSSSALTTIILRAAKDTRLGLFCSEWKAVLVTNACSSCVCLLTQVIPTFIY